MYAILGKVRDMYHLGMREGCNAGFNKSMWMWKDDREVAVNDLMLRSRMLDTLL